MRSHLSTSLSRLRSSSLAVVRNRAIRSHDELERTQLAELQQAFIRLPYNIEPSGLILFDAVSVSMQGFVRQLLQHYILERDILEDSGYGPCASGAYPRQLLERLRHQHQTIQESLSELQGITREFSEIACSPKALEFRQMLERLGDSLHTQILEENSVLLPRSHRN